MTSLKQFIRNVRAAKTIADERAVVQKESAAIRSSFREESHDSYVRRNNVAKLLYLFTLGERTHFGQIECLKLLASPRFADKRLGYLGTMLLLDENQEVLTLVTNSLQNDLKSSNPHIVHLALVTLGNIASVEMSRDLFTDVATMLSSQNTYIRRKAALCAMRICRKVPDLQEHFIDKAKLLLNDRNHGVLLCGVTLMTSLCEAEEEGLGPEDGDSVIEAFKLIVPQLVKLLKALSTAGYAPEHDVTGITDPFLQVKILRLLRVLGRNDAQVSEQINDILAQVATNTDATKNVGNSILYESVLTILDIEADSGLRVLGVNILGKFLSNRDNNIRYVALNTLTKVVTIEPTAVQRHRNTILDCLRDPDVSIRRRALELSFTLINESNVRVLVRELLSFLEVADTEFKPTMTSQIGIAADRFAPNKRWHVDTMLRVLKLAGNHTATPILSSFLRLVAQTTELQTYTVQKLYAALREDISQEGLILAATWAIGEYGDLLLKGGQYEEEELVKEVKESEIVDLLESITSSAYASQQVIEYIVTAAVKLTTRINEAGQIERLRRLLQSNRTNLDVEVQQRAVEYTNLFAYDAVRRGVLEKMPAPEIKEEQRVLGEATQKRKSKAPPKKRGPTTVTSAADDLLDFSGDSNPTPALNGHSGGATSSADLLEIIGGASSSPAPSAGSGQQSNIANIMGMFDNSSSSSTPAPAASSADLLGGLSSAPAPQQPAAPAAHPVYNKNGLQIAFQLRRDNQAIQLMGRFRNTGGSPVSGLNLLAAVPKTQKLQLQGISRTDLGPGEEATQAMRIQGVNGPPPAKLRLRLKITYQSPATGNVLDQVDWSEPA